MAQVDFNLLKTNIPAEAANSAMKGMQQVNALTTQNLANRASEMEIGNALAEQAAFKGAATPQEAQQRLMQAGLGKSAMAIGTTLAGQAKTQAETKKVGLESTAKSMDIMRERTKDLLGNPSNENYIAHVQEGLRDGLISPEQAQRSVQIFTSVPPNERVGYLTQQLAKAEKVYEMNTIGKAQQAQMDVTMRGQNMSESTARRGQDLQNAPNVVANTVTGADGTITQFNRFGQIIGQPGAVGKPSATFEKTAALQKQQGKDLDLAIKELTEVIKDNGLIDQSTGSGIGRAVDAAAGVFGSATPGAIAIAKLNPIADLGLKMIPRFEGPQSDKDTAAYKEAAGQLANPSLPTEIRKAAGKTVVRLMKERKGQFVNDAMAAEGIGGGSGGVDANNPLLKQLGI